MMVVSSFIQELAAQRGVRIESSSPKTERSDSELELWRRSVSWGVNPMPNRILAVNEQGNCIGASYYDDKGFLSALAVLPEYRGKRI